MIPIEDVISGQTFQVDPHGAAWQCLPYDPIYMMTDATEAKPYATIVPVYGPYAGLAFQATNGQGLMVTLVEIKVTRV